MDLSDILVEWFLAAYPLSDVFRTAIEVFPKDKNLVDVMDVYHLWIFSKDFEMPFGIHPTKDKQPRTIQRGCPKDPTRLIENYKQYNEEHKDVMGEDAFFA